MHIYINVSSRNDINSARDIGVNKLPTRAIRNCKIAAAVGLLHGISQKKCGDCVSDAKSSAAAVGFVILLLHKPPSRERQCSNKVYTPPIERFYRAYPQETRSGRNSVGSQLI
jgi:hypothetical protein